MFVLDPSGDPPCAHGGSCSYNNSCYCDYGFSGPHCEIGKSVLHSIHGIHVCECIINN